MISDRELLELAAKAAKMDCRIRYCGAWKGMALYTPQDGYFGPTWNPLTDDGDALRLAVKLRMDVTFNETHVFAFPPDGSEGSSELINVDDPYAATRQAIVRAAAEIGKGMP